ncbi:MAG TPA: VWA domain-containing protein [Methanosarcinales archaeon]|nr:VWA domain-containing protein [Methanosarcinales archaeon]
MYLAHQSILLLTIPILVAAAYLIRKGHRKGLIVTRAVVFMLLIISLASPYDLVSQTVFDETPSITIIDDHTGSMALFDNDTGLRVYERLKSRTPTEIRQITGDRTSIGDAIAEFARGNDNILLVSDGNNNHGLDLTDTIAFARAVNTTICAIRLEPEQNDLSVEISGGKDVVVESEQSFIVTVRQATSGVSGSEYTLSVWIDGVNVDERVVRQTEREKSISISHTFTELGSHTIKAEIMTENEDARQFNNVFYKTVYVIPRPKILSVSDRSSPLSQTLSELYDATTVSSATSLDPGQQLAVVLDNIHANDLDRGEVERLGAYLRKGGGLVVVGGDRAYDKGGYYNSPLGFETLLPVRSKESAGEGANVGVVIVIDISGSVGTAYGADTALSMEKALAINILRGININDHIGVIAFNQNAHIVSSLTRGLYKSTIEEKITRLKHGGTTHMDVAQNAASVMLDGYAGAKSVIVISDGETSDKDACIGLARSMADAGITTYAVGVGETTDEDFMRSLASAGGGIYYRPAESERLSVIFGEKPEEPDDTAKGDFSIIVLNPNHFISEQLELSGSLTGYNKVTPKTGAQTLVTTGAGKPILTAWRFGMGHVVALSTDDGVGWSGTLYSGKNALLISKMVNWAVGDPRRNDEIVISADDVHLGDDAIINVRSGAVPSINLDGEKLELSQVDEDRYQASIMADSQGFMDISGYMIAVNYPLEFRDVGFSEDLESTIGMLGGGVYAEDDIEPLIAHLKERSTREVEESEEKRLPFLLAAMLIFLGEVVVRRLREISRMRKG